MSSFTQISTACLFDPELFRFSLAILVRTRNFRVHWRILYQCAANAGLVVNNVIVMNFFQNIEQIKPIKAQKEILFQNFFHTTIQEQYGHSLTTDGIFSHYS